jgi:hypothetical protein
MAYQLSHTTPDGVTHAESYWVVNLSLNGISKTGMVALIGYHNQQARQSNSAPINSKLYPIEAADYTQYFSPTVLDVAGENAMKAAYAFALLMDDDFLGDAEVV